MIGGGGGLEHERARVNALANTAILEANRRDLDEIRRARHLDQLGATGHVSFGFYVSGFGEAEVGSLCSAAVTPVAVIFFDADESAEPDAELGRAPRASLTLAVEEQRRTIASIGFDAPWRMRSMATPGAIDVDALVIVTWPEGSATFAFATVEGARESVDALRSHLSRAAEL